MYHLGFSHIHVHCQRTGIDSTVRLKQNGGIDCIRSWYETDQQTMTGWGNRKYGDSLQM